MLKKVVNLSLFFLGVSILIIPLTTWAWDDYRFDSPDSSIGAYWNPNIPSPSLDLGVGNLNIDSVTTLFQQVYEGKLSIINDLPPTSDMQLLTYYLIPPQIVRC